MCNVYSVYLHYNNVFIRCEVPRLSQAYHYIVDRYKVDVDKAQVKLVPIKTAM